jgi:phosphatidylglycerophosphate synthase
MTLPIVPPSLASANRSRRETGRIVTIPNAISLARLLMAIPIAILISQGRWTAAFILLLVSAASDGLDGFLARKLGQESALGRLLDPAADKAVILTTAVMLAWGDVAMLNPVSGWFPTVLFVREGLVVGVGLFLGSQAYVPSLAGKVSMAVSDVAVIVAVGFEAAAIPSPFVAPLLLLAVALSVASLAGYALERLIPALARPVRRG